MLLLYVSAFQPWDLRILAPQPGIQPSAPALKCKVSTTGPYGEVPWFSLFILLHYFVNFYFCISLYLLYFSISKKSGECHTYRAGEIKIAIVSMNLLFLYGVSWHKIWKVLILWIKERYWDFLFPTSNGQCWKSTEVMSQKTPKQLARSLKISVRITCVTRLTGYLIRLIIQFSQNPYATKSLL